MLNLTSYIGHEHNVSSYMEFKTMKALSLVCLFVPDEKFFVGDYEVDLIVLSVCLSVCLFKTLSYLLNQASEVHETLPVLFLCQ